MNINNLDISLADREIRINKRPMKLRERYFSLYCYLALVRKAGDLRNGGYVEMSQILQLPLWRRNKLKSVGKQISRHCEEMQKKKMNCIEAIQKVTGPFRLRISPDRIHFDVSVEIIKDFLGFPTLMIPSPPELEISHYQFVTHVSDGDSSFNDGHVKKAENAYRKALGKAVIPEWRAVAFHKIGRTLERQGKYEEAISTQQSALNCFSDNQQFGNWGKAMAYVYLGWVHYQEKNLFEAEQCYTKAWNLVRVKGHYRISGDICNGLGEIRKEQNRYEEAIDYYKSAIHYWVIAEYYYGIQGAFCNIGQIYEKWGDEMRGQAEVCQRYQTGIQWVNQGIELCQKLAIADDTSEDHILLSNLYLKLGDHGSALKYGEIARQMAEVADNKKDIACAYRVLIKTYQSQGKTEKAQSAFSACQQKIGGTRFMKIVKDVLIKNSPRS